MEIASTDPDYPGVYYEERLLGGPGRYHVTYDVWNYHANPSFAQIVTEETA